MVWNLYFVDIEKDASKMIVSHQYKFVFAEIPKNASRSVAEMLINDYAAFRVDVPLLQHPKVDCGRFSRHSVNFDAQCGDYFYFGVVRNPFDRAVSIYRHIKNHDRSNASFDQIASAYFAGDWVCCHDHACMVFNQCDFEIKPFDFFAKFENLESDLKRLPFLDKKFEIPEMFKDSFDKNYAAYYTPETMKIVSEWAKEDFDRFGYDRIYRSFI